VISADLISITIVTASPQSLIYRAIDSFDFAQIAQGGHDQKTMKPGNPSLITRPHR